MTRNPFVDHCLEVLAPVGDMRARQMFGGWGLYCGDVMVGLIADDVLYLKVDDDSRSKFEAAGLRPFVYTGKKDGKPMAMSYHEAPQDAMEEPDAMRPWAELALAAALRAQAAKKPNRKRPKKD